jgi:hypothetical protein
MPMADLDARIVTEHGGHRIIFSLNGAQLETPPVEHVFFYVGLAVLAGTGIVEWPIALAVGIGHALVDITGRPGLQAAGEALAEA